MLYTVGFIHSAGGEVRTLPPVYWFTALMKRVGQQCWHFKAVDRAFGFSYTSNVVANRDLRFVSLGFRCNLVTLNAISFKLDGFCNVAKEILAGKLLS
jgi:hypothetical protein